MKEYSWNLSYTNLYFIDAFGSGMKEIIILGDMYWIASQGGNMGKKYK